VLDAAFGAPVPDATSVVPPAIVYTTVKTFPFGVLYVAPTVALAAVTVKV
jgi:hypothetical protein